MTAQRVEQGQSVHAGTIRAGVRVVPFQPEHLEALSWHPSQGIAAGLVTREHGEALQQAGPCVTLTGGGQIVLCAGLLPTESRTLAWAVLGDLGAYEAAAGQALRRILEGAGLPCIEWEVDPRDLLMRRVATRLGFVAEATQINMVRRTMNHTEETHGSCFSSNDDSRRGNSSLRGDSAREAGESRREL